MVVSPPNSFLGWGLELIISIMTERNNMLCFFRIKGIGAGIQIVSVYFSDYVQSIILLVNLLVELCKE